jgi:hypothetical protein
MVIQLGTVSSHFLKLCTDVPARETHLPFKEVHFASKTFLRDIALRWAPGEITFD